MLGFFTYIPTLYKIPHAAFLLCILILAWRWYTGRGSLSLKINRPVKLGKIEWVLLLIIGLSFVNHFLHFNPTGGLRELLPYTALVILTYFIAKNLNRSDVQILLIMGVAESGVLVYELYEGVSTIFSGHKDYMRFTDNTYLYYQRAFGLSDNSSSLANKLFVVLILCDYFKLDRKWEVLLKWVLIAGIILTFNRTILIVLVFYQLLVLVRWISRIEWKRREAIIGFSLIGAGILIGLFIFVNYWDVILDQFTRGRGQVELAGRNYIWKDFAGFIQENSLFGNGSHKLYMHDTYHAHNSYLQLMATHGLPVFILYVLLIFFGISWQNIVFMAPILLYSVTQYGLFWGISIMDIAFFAMILKNARAVKELKHSVT